MTIKKKSKLPIDVLIKHLKTHKDAVIILGPDIVNKDISVKEESKDDFNRKNMVKKPEKFWSYYVDNLMSIFECKNKTTQNIEKLLNLNIHENVIDTNIINILDKSYNVIAPTGKNDTLECVKCSKKYNSIELKGQLKTQDTTLKCDCGGNIKPTILCFGEKYPLNTYNKVKDAIFIEENNTPKLNTHTLIFVGVDFSDTLMSEIIDSYDALKDNQHFTVVIADKGHRDDVIFYNPEFGVCDELDQAISRLIDLLKK